MVCGDRIGWRRDARRVVILTTDQSFHTALDGKLGGIVRPNDGKCHLDRSGYYAKSKIQGALIMTFIHGYVSYVQTSNFIYLRCSEIGYKVCRFYLAQPRHGQAE